MPKNKSRNAFFFFMAEWKKKAEAHGRKFPNGFRDVQADPDCNAKWQSLTKQEKGPYEAMAKKDKISSQIENRSKRTTLGESISMLEQKEREEEKFKRDMQENIKFTIDTAVNFKILPKQKFCFVHVNWFFSMIVDNSIKYFPAEYAFGIFSFENGIEEVHHVIVSAKIPLGFKREALEMSQNTHKVPVEHTGGETDFATMYMKLVNFLEPRKLVNKYLPLYTTRNNTGAVQSLVAKLCDAAQQDKSQFKIYELESLYIHLANETFKNSTDRDIKYIPAYAGTKFTAYTYTFERGFECSFHRYIDGGSEYCSKSILQQWVWTLCDEFGESLEVDMQPGVHYPDKSDINVSDINALTYSMSNLGVNNTRQSEPEYKSTLSMTGVSEQHRLKVSCRTHQEEARRRNESKPVHVIDYSKASESVDKSVDESLERTINKLNERKKYVPNYLCEKPMRPPNIDPDVFGVDEFTPKTAENFPPIGGRGASCKLARTNMRKMPLGRGQGHA